MTPVAGQKVKQEQRLLTFDLNDIKEHAASAISPMIFTNRTEEEMKRIRMN
nr:PTS glucose transporter subunit IIA [Bacillus atrophaeus]